MRPTSALFAMLAATLVLAGCGHSSPTSNTTTDPAAQYAGEQGVQSSAASLPDEFESTTYEDGAEAKVLLGLRGLGSGHGMKVQRLHPVCFSAFSWLAV